jgi:hypothetical protein
LVYLSADLAFSNTVGWVLACRTPIALLPFDVWVLRVLGHDILELRPQGFDGGELVADGDDAFQVAVEAVEILKDVFERLLRSIVSNDARLPCG